MVWEMGQNPFVVANIRMEVLMFYDVLVGFW